MAKSLDFTGNIMRYHIFIDLRGVLIPIRNSFWKMRINWGEMSKTVNFEIQ